MKKWIPIILASSLAFTVISGCSSQNGVKTETETEVETAKDQETAGEKETSPQEETGSVQTDEDMFTERDQDGTYDEDSCVRIQLEGSSAAADSDSVQISGNTVTITEEAAYIISGELEDGMIIVDAPDTAKIQLVLDGADIASAASAPLYILEADKVFVTLAEGSENTLSNGGTYTAIDDNNIDAVIFSKQDLTLNGSGALKVNSPGGNGITSKDDLVITGGTYNITALSHGLEANDSIRITGETKLTIEAGKDGIHAENDEDDSLGFVYISKGDFHITAEGDGISAGAYMQIKDGQFQLQTGGGSANGTQTGNEAWGRGTGGEGFGERGPRGGGPRREMTEEDTEGDRPERNMQKGGRPDGRVPADDAAPSQEQPEETAAEETSTSMKGLKAGGDMIILGGSFTIDSADDAVHSNSSITVNGGNFEIASGDDAFHGDDTLTITAGTINITESYEGLEALHVYVEGGDITLAARDDGLNAAGGTDSSGAAGERGGMAGGRRGGMSSSNGSITIAGGNLYINAYGDGIDANGTITITGGYTVVDGPVQGDTSILDYDTSAVITGGTFIGTGSAHMTQNFSQWEQGVIWAEVGEPAEGTSVTVTDQDGNTIVSAEPKESFQLVIVSSPDLSSGETYTLTAGSVSTEAEAE